MLIRDAEPARDAAACAAIYAVSVRGGAASFEDVAPDDSEMATRITATRRGWPWLVAELDGSVAGYAHGSLHRERSAYRWATNVSVYVSSEHHRRGVGARSTRRCWIASPARGSGWRVRVSRSPTPRSVALHESLGFELVGVYRNIGFKLGRWWDVGWWQVALGPGEPDAGLPAEPRAPAAD